MGIILRWNRDPTLRGSDAKTWSMREVAVDKGFTADEDHLLLELLDLEIES